jgi:hypothetical protein
VVSCICAVHTRLIKHRHAYASVLLVTPCVNNGAVGKQTNASARGKRDRSALSPTRVTWCSQGLCEQIPQFLCVVCACYFPVSAFRFSIFAFCNFWFLAFAAPYGHPRTAREKFCARARAVSAGRILTANPQSQTAAGTGTGTGTSYW